ncbi:MAG: PHP domain-containing protein, partial [Methylobacteriaceae bacterium]|nr:PHP domain-containing protein [Methylobacteriaceae bacterium]
MIDSVGFVHLHAHTSYSLREGALGIAKLIKLAAADRQPAIAITDTNNLFGALEFSEKAAKEGIQPIIGLQLTLDFGDGAAMGARHYESGAGWANVVLIAQNEMGYHHLMKLASAAYLETAGEQPHLAVPRLTGHTQGLIALTGGPTGPLDRACSAGRHQVATARLDALTPLFDGRLYVELQRHGLESERATEAQILDIAYRAGLPLVATNEPFFAARSDHEAHDALLCIAEGTLISDQKRRQLSPEHRFKTRAEMLALFADLPEATRHSVEIAMRASFRPATRNPILPRFAAGEGAGEAAELRRQAESGL